MAWPLIAVGAALIAGSAAGASSEEGEGTGDILDMKHPYQKAPSTEEQLASKALLDVAQKLYEDSNGSDPEFYKKVFEGLPESKMSDTDRARLSKQYSEISLLANQKAMEQAGQAFGENIDSLVNRGVLAPAQADKMKLQNEAQVRSMMSILDKRWKATEIADSRKMWIGDQQSKARGVGLIAETRAKNQAMFNSVVDSGLKFGLRRAGAIQDFQGAQMTANENVLTAKRAAEYDFWGKMLMPGKASSGGSSMYNYSRSGVAQPGYGGSGGYMDYYGSGLGGGYIVPDSSGSYAGSGYYNGSGGFGGYMD